MEQNTSCIFMFPIILYIDKTKISLNGKLTVFPVTMSLSIFSKATRSQSRTWRPLGCIANEECFFSIDERAENHANIKNERVHRQLEVILKSFYKAQEPNALQNILLQLGQACKRVNLYVPLQFIIGDVEGGDQLASCQTFKGKICLCLCHTCDVSTANCAPTDVQCERISVADVEHLVATSTVAELNQFRQHPGFNSLYKIDCGGDPYGVFSMIRTEGLHALEVGLISYSLEILFEDLTPRQQSKLDGLVKRLVLEPRQHGYDPFPRLLWPDGVTTLSLLTGDLKVGKMMAIIAVALTLEGEQFFTQYLDGGEVTWKKMVYVFQQLICYWTWLKQERFWQADDPAARESAAHSIRIMIDQLQAFWPRTTGFKWNITKLHKQMHVAEDIQRHGVHKNIHSAPQGHNHIDIKKAAKKTQRNKKTIDEQTGKRLMERLAIQRAYDYVTHKFLQDKSNQKDSNPTVNASKATYRVVQEHGLPTVSVELLWKRAKHHGLEPLYIMQISLRF
jgi:hypothetical protein